MPKNIPALPKLAQMRKYADPSKSFGIVLIVYCALMLFASSVYAQAIVLDPPTGCPSPRSLVSTAGRFTPVRKIEALNKSLSPVTFYHVMRNGNFDFQRLAKPGIGMYESTMGRGDENFVAVTPRGFCLGGSVPAGAGAAPAFYEINNWQGNGNDPFPHTEERKNFGACPVITADTARMLRPKSYQPKLTIRNETGQPLSFVAYNADGSVHLTGNLGQMSNDIFGSRNVHFGYRLVAKSNSGVCVGGVLKPVNETDTIIRLTAVLPPSVPSPQTQAPGNPYILQCIANPTGFGCNQISAFCRSDPANGFCRFNVAYDPNQNSLANRCRRNIFAPGCGANTTPQPTQPAQPFQWNPFTPRNPAPTTGVSPQPTQTNPIPTPQPVVPTTTASVSAWWRVMCPSFSSLNVANPQNNAFPRNARFFNQTQGRIVVFIFKPRGRREYRWINPGKSYTFRKLMLEPQRFLIKEQKGLCIGGVQQLQNVGTTSFIVK